MPENVDSPYSERYLEEKHRILFQTLDGKIVAMGKNYEVVASGTRAVNVRVPDLGEIEAVLNIQVHTDPATDWECIGNKKIVGNVVGLTVYDIAAGTTLTVEIIASGIPT